jgi:8-oxo-dGTP pyrophosphatase MutT (NUDIX family)
MLDPASESPEVFGKFLVVVAFVIERDGHILLMRRSATKDHAPGEWEVGSGRMRPGESPLEAVRREAREETGLDVEVLGLLDTFHFYRGAAREEAVGITFHCRAAPGSLKLSDEHDQARWVPLEQLSEADCADWMHRGFAALRRQAPSASL